MYTLGIDASTQGVKALVRDAESGAVVASAAVSFGRDLPAFGCPDGFLPDPDPRIRRADPRMWLAALDLVLERLSHAFELSRIDAVGGDGQQHGSVYLNASWTAALRRVEGGAADGECLTDVFKGVFSRDESPIWMDSSTTAEVGELNRMFPDLQRRTGSPAIERFTGPQIMKFASENPVAWEATCRVHLVSSFLCSVLAGTDAPVDTGDGAGTNLLDLGAGCWAEDICAQVAPDLIAKLPSVSLPGAATTLKLASYFVRYGFHAGIPVVPFTGDNPASLVGTGADRPGVAVISLGTSDTFFAALPGFRTDPMGYGHVFGNPSGGFMSLACFKNGSLARDRVRRDLGVDWTFFDARVETLDVADSAALGGAVLAARAVRPQVNQP